MTIIKTTVYSGYDTFTSERTVDDFVYNAIDQSLGFPSPDADLFSRMLCTDVVTIKRVTKSRADLIKVLSREIAEELAEIISKNDTVMGYKKDEITNL